MRKLFFLLLAFSAIRLSAQTRDSIPTVEGQWHRIYLHLQSLLGQLKLQQNKQVEKPSSGWNIFSRK